MAEKTMDLQDYIWDADTTGRILNSRLVEAADRGLRVRILVDDNTLAGRDSPFVATATGYSWMTITKDWRKENPEVKSLDGKVVASVKLPQTIAFRMSLDETLDIGEDTGTPVSEDYKVPFKFTGDLKRVTIKITEKKLTEEQLRHYREGLLKRLIGR